MQLHLMKGGRIAAIEVLDNTPNHDDAIGQAGAIFIGHMGLYERFEVWDSSRLVFQSPMIEPFKFFGLQPEGSNTRPFLP